MRGMKAWIALLAVAALFGVVYVGVGLAGQQFLFGVVIPYVAIVVLLVGLVYRVLQWAGAPVPFRIPTVCGQQKSLPFIKHSRFDSPASGLQAAGRMALEVLLFRSLFRNTRVGLTPTQRVIHQSDKLLWVGALAFHWCLLLILLRHLRYFLEPVPALILFLEQLDGFFQLTAPTFLLSSALIGAALLFLLGRRLLDPQVRFISLPADYFPLFLLLGIVGSGIFMRYITKTDLLGSTRGEAALGRPGHLATDRARERRAAVLFPPLPGQLSVRLLPVQQADAPRRGLPQPDEESRQQQSHAPPRQPLEPGGGGPHLPAMGG
jgi:nitrate reductase gamma subunit